MRIRRSIVCVMFLPGLLLCSGSKLRENELRDSEISIAEQEYKSSSWLERLHAVQRAGKWINAQSQALLINAVSDTHYRVRIEAVKELSKFRSLQSFEIIKETADTEKYLPLRIASLQALAQFQNLRSAQTFINSLTDEEWIIRECGIIGLLDIPDPGIEKMSIQYIVDALSDVNESVRIAALQYTRVRDERIYLILRALIADESILYKTTLLTAVLRSLNGYKLDDKARKHVLALITHPNTEVRSLAYRCIMISDDMK